MKGRQEAETTSRRYIDGCKENGPRSVFGLSEQVKQAQFTSMWPGMSSLQPKPAKQVFSILLVLNSP